MGVVVKWLFTRIKKMKSTCVFCSSSYSLLSLQIVFSLLLKLWAALGCRLGQKHLVAWQWPWATTKGFPDTQPCHEGNQLTEVDSKSKFENLHVKLNPLHLLGLHILEKLPVQNLHFVISISTSDFCCRFLQVSIQGPGAACWCHLVVSLLPAWPSGRPACHQHFLGQAPRSCPHGVDALLWGCVYQAMSEHLQECSGSLITGIAWKGRCGFLGHQLETSRNYQTLPLSVLNLQSGLRAKAPLQPLLKQVQSCACHVLDFWEPPILYCSKHA